MQVWVGEDEKEGGVEKATGTGERDEAPKMAALGGGRGGWQVGWATGGAGVTTARGRNGPGQPLPAGRMYLFTHPRREDTSAPNEYESGLAYSVAGDKAGRRLSHRCQGPGNTLENEAHACPRHATCGWPSPGCSLSACESWRNPMLLIILTVGRLLTLSGRQGINSPVGVPGAFHYLYSTLPGLVPLPAVHSGLLIPVLV